ncbi:MAG TPA: C4-dicarboxylic acid transporter DauA [Candidatus Polarisedimenticolia bacterium]|nr:C4-dicarboxylic acid transporter DauA [Candidatus Polarisedimenticolia bacterium]
MPKRLVRAVQLAAVRPGQGLRDAFSAGYGARDLRADLLAGAVVGIVALPLSMALAIASGVPPQQGLYTAIVAGAVAALLGGSRVQVTGPTAAFVVVLAPIAAHYGLGGLLVATLLAGLLLVGMGTARLGRLIEFVPYPVTTGFTAGIAVVIGVLQLKDFLGLDVARMPEHFVERIAVLVDALPTLDRRDLATGLATMAILVLWPRVTKRVPAPLVALFVVTAATWWAESLLPGFQVDTIARRFSYAGPDGLLPGIPRLPPLPGWPWSFPGPDGAPLPLSWDLIRTLMGPAFAIAMLGAIESLLSATVADGMTGGKHDSDAELIGQGIANIVAPFFGGIAATGAIARTATNVRYGARSPFAAVTHALFVLVAVLALAPVLGHLPMAALAAILLVVAWNMGEFKHVWRVLRIAPRGDVIVLLTCFGLTVLFDMVVSVSVGVVLAALLFMERMAETATSDLIAEGHPDFEKGLPRNMVIYEVAGPLFFGAAQKAMSTLRALRKNVKVVVLDLRAVPVMDATGLVNLESAIARLREAGIFVVLGGLQRQPAEVMQRAGWRDDAGRLALCASFAEAVEIGRRRVAEVEGSAGP